ncbi:hypothetical protein ABZ804_21900 [Streptomyces sp. NPDC047726]
MQTVVEHVIPAVITGIFTSVTAIVVAKIRQRQTADRPEGTDDTTR